MRLLRPLIVTRRDLCAVLWCDITALPEPEMPGRRHGSGALCFVAEFPFVSTNTDATSGYCRDSQTRP